MEQIVACTMGDDFTVSAELDGDHYMASLHFMGESILLSGIGYPTPEAAIEAAKQALIVLGRFAEARL